MIRLGCTQDSTPINPFWLSAKPLQNAELCNHDTVERIAHKSRPRRWQSTDTKIARRGPSNEVLRCTNQSLEPANVFRELEPLTLVPSKVYSMTFYVTGIATKKQKAV